VKIAVVAPPVAPDKTTVFPRHPPLLAASLAATLRERGDEVLVLDAFLEGLSAAESADRILSSSPDLVVVMPNDVARETPVPVTGAMLRHFRSRGGESCLIAAGAGHAGWVKRLVADLPELDGAVLGDPEAAVLAVASALAEGRDWREAEWAVHRGSGDRPLRAAVLATLDGLPDPAWDLVPLERYVVLPHRRAQGAEYPLLASRGCYWNRCRFCQDLACVKSSEYRVRSPARVAREMRRAAGQWGTRHFLFHDAVFPTREAWLRELIREREAVGASGTWFCMARADSVSPAALRLMKKGGCSGICFGLESGSETMLRRMDKGHGLDVSRRAVEWAQEAGLEVSATFIFGFPGEGAAEAAATIEFALESGVDFAQFLLVKWHQVPTEWLAEGVLREDWELTQYDYRGMVFVPRAYGSLSRLKMVRSYAYVRFYLRPAYLLKTLGHVRDVSDLRRYAAGGWTLLQAVLNR
jgi:radical SAM superfamily enzyme YgiQ (UPF0313 family)